MRRTKYNDEIRGKVLMYTSEGRTVRDICKLLDITDMTILRWRRRYPDFDEQYLNAIRRQYQGVEALRKSGVRTYRRNAEKLQEKAVKRSKIEKLDEEQQEVARSGKPLVYEGLRIRYGSIADDEPLTPCVNPSNGFVEYLKRQGGNYIQFSCSLDAFRKNNPVWYRELTEQNSALDVGD